METGVKGTLEYDLNDPEQLVDFEAAKNIRGLRKLTQELIRQLFQLKQTDTVFMLKKTRELAVQYKQKEILSLCDRLLVS